MKQLSGTSWRKYQHPCFPICNVSLCHLSCGVGGVPNVIQNTKPLVNCEVILKHIIVQGKNSILVPIPQTLFSGTCHILLQGMAICVTASMHPENITSCKIAQ